jgi:uncharacterized protein involved in exopolysaccharide biosynthesis
MVGEMHHQPLTFGVWVAGVIARWRLILKVMAGVLVAAALAVVLVPPIYKAHASFVTTSSGSSKASSMMGSSGLSGIASQLGVPALAGGEPSESPMFYIKLVESDELKRRLLNSKFHDPRSERPGDSATLLAILRIKNSDSVRRMEIGMKQVSKAIKADADLKTNLVSLSASARWPQIAAAMANRTVALVDAFNHEQRVSRARSKREFLQTRLDSAKIELSRAEENQRAFYVENRQWRSSPDLTYQEAKLRRDADVATDLFLTLQRQFETARLEEVDDAAVITVVDSAVVPHKAEWPRYWLLLASALVVGAILGVLAAGSAAIFEDWRNRNPATAAALRRSIQGLPRVIKRRRAKTVAESIRAPVS